MDVKRDTFKVIWMKMILLIAPLVIIAMSFMVSLAKDYPSTGTTLAVLLIMLLANYQVFSSLYPILAKITLDEEKVNIKYPFWGKEKTFNYSQLKMEKSLNCRHFSSPTYQRLKISFKRKPTTSVKSHFDCSRQSGIGYFGGIDFIPSN